jgi:hypothetical protein
MLYFVNIYIYKYLYQRVFHVKWNMKNTEYPDQKSHFLGQQQIQYYILS